MVMGNGGWMEEEEKAAVVVVDEDRMIRRMGRWSTG